MKCDIIIPVYKAPEWVKLCVYALFTNTNPKYINKVYLINDCDDQFTSNCLTNLKNKYDDKIVIKQNKNNLGFIKTTNRGIKLSTAEYVLLLNSDCLLSNNTIEKLIHHIKNNPKIGLICPLASNAANLTIPIPEGWNYTQIDTLLEKHFSGQCFDACTVVGNCLMITRKCIDKVGLLDESYGTGYGEETDYQFKAMKKGFEAKVAIDTYVFHKAEASFGTSKEKQARLQKNRDLFFSRWGEQYRNELKKYNKNDPIKYIYNHLPKDSWRPKIKTLFYLDGIVQNAGGVHTVIDIVNYLTINGKSINVLYNLKYPYKESLLFNPLPSDKVNEATFKQIVSTVWKTAFEAHTIAKNNQASLLSFVQGYELYFENGTKYGSIELSYKISNGILTISKYLQKELQNVFKEPSHVIPNTINYDLIHLTVPNKNSTPAITIVLRGNPMKGDWLLMDIIKKLSEQGYKLIINLISIEKNISLPSINNKNTQINLIVGPQERNTIYQLLQSSVIYIDASLSEGFGLTALEAMASGCIPIVSDSMGINEYIKHNKNGIIIKDVNNSDSFVKAILNLLKDKKAIQALSQNALNTAKEYDFDESVPKYITYFDNPDLKAAPPSFNKTESGIIDAMWHDHNQHARRIKAFNVAQKLVPSPAKKKIASTINKLYNYINK